MGGNAAQGIFTKPSALEKSSRRGHHRAKAGDFFKASFYKAPGSRTGKGGERQTGQRNNGKKTFTGFKIRKEGILCLQSSKIMSRRSSAGPDR
jgi:hypothetical protein